MATWSEARKRHSVVRRCADEDTLQARALWAATKGVGEPDPDSFAEAVMDTAPIEFTAILSQGKTANAYALSCVWDFRDRAEHSTSFDRREMAREAWERFRRRAEQADDIRRGLGCDDSEAWETMRDTKVAKNEMAVVQKIAKLAGRMYAQLCSAKATIVSAMPDELHDVELGSNLARLLPSELVHLGQSTEILLLDNLANGKALQFKYRGAEQAGRGPLVIALDESGSMDGGYGVSRREWSKAAAVALTRVAHDDDRCVSIVHFSGSVLVRELRPGDTKGILDMIRHWFDGGTAIPLALSNCADEVTRLQQQGDRGADVVIVTDAEYYENRHHKLDREIDKIESLGSRLWTVAVECNVGEEHPLRARAEHFIQIAGEHMRAGEVGDLQGTVI